MMSSDEEPCLVRVVGENVNLIRGESEDEVVEKKEDKITCYLFLLTTFTALGGFLFGYDTGVISGAMIPLKKQFQLSKLLQESIVSVALVGAILGSLGSGVLNNRLGRRPSVILGGFLFTAGSLVMGLANGSTVLLLGRFLVGLGIGLVSMVVPVYIAEAAPSRMRGQLVTTNVAFITFGQFFASVLNGVFTSTISQQGWRLMLGAAALPSFILMVGFYWMPESPRWLISKGMDIYRGILEAEFFEEKQIKTELKEHSKVSEIEKVTKVEKVDKSTQFFLLEEVVAYKRMREVADKIHRSTFIESDLPRRVMQMKKENQALNNSLQDLKKMLKRDRLNKVVDTLAPENKIATGNDDVTLPAPNKLNPSSVNFLNQQTNQQLPSHEVYPRISEVKSMHPSAAPVQSTIYHNMYQPRYDALSLYQKQYNMLAHQQQMHQLGMYSPEYYHKLTAFYQQRTLIEQQQNQAYQQQHQQQQKQQQQKQQQQKQHFNYQQSQQVEQLTREQMQRNQAMFYNSPQNRPQESLLRQKLRERVAHKERKVSSGIAQCTPEQRWRHNVKRDSLNQKIFRLSNRQPPIIQQTIQKIHQQKTPVIAVDDALVANYSLVVAKPHQLNAAASQAVNEAIETTATQVESNSSAEVESTASSCSNSFIEKLANYRPELQPLNVVIPKESNVSQQSSVDQSIIKQVDMNNNVQKVGYTLTPPPSP